MFRYTMHVKSVHVCSKPLQMLSLASLQTLGTILWLSLKKTRAPIESNDTEVLEKGHDTKTNSNSWKTNNLSPLAQHEKIDLQRSQPSGVILGGLPWENSGHCSDTFSTISQFTACGDKVQRKSLFSQRDCAQNKLMESSQSTYAAQSWKMDGSD